MCGLLKACPDRRRDTRRVKGPRLPALERPGSYFSCQNTNPPPRSRRQWSFSAAFLWQTRKPAPHRAENQWQVGEMEKVFRTLLINPPALSRAEMHDLPDYPHAGLAYLAGSLRDAGSSVRVVDAKLERLSIEETLDRIFRQDVDLVGITSMTHEIDSAVRLAEGIKNRQKPLPIVMGGVHVTALPADTLEAYPEFDFAVFGRVRKPSSSSFLHSSTAADSRKFVASPGETAC